MLLVLLSIVGVIVVSILLVIRSAMMYHIPLSISFNTGSFCQCTFPTPNNYPFEGGSNSHLIMKASALVSFNNCPFYLPSGIKLSFICDIRVFGTAY